MHLPHPTLSRRRFLTGMTLAATATATRPRRSYAASSPGGDSASADAWHHAETILARIRVPSFPLRRSSVRDFGARASADVDARPAFLEAINSCNAMGGGTVTVPAGDWRLDGPIMLKSNVRLHLEEGARLHFSTHADHYLPLVLTRWEGTELFNYSPFIFAYQCTNVALTGPGVIDGHGTTTFAAWRDRQKPAQRRLRDMGGLGTAVHERIFGPDQWLRPSFVQFFGCTNVLIEGVTHVDSPFWCLHTIACHNVTVRRVRVDSIRINNDGVDIESCSDVLIEDCELRCGDDCIALKSGRDQDGWRLGRPTENVVLRRIRMEAPTTGSGLAIGSEMSGGVRAIFGEDIQIGRAPVALNIKGNLDRGGCVEQVHLRRFAVEKADTFILFTTAYQGYRGGQHPPVFRDFDIEEASCRAAVVPIHAVGVPDAPLQDIHLRRVAVEHAEQPPRIDQVSGFHADDVVINGTPWPTPVAPG